MDPLEIRYGDYILLIISLLLLIREIFSIATVNNAAKQDNEHLWYPLIALPEILVIIFYLTPGLVPRRDELIEYAVAHITPEVGGRRDRNDRGLVRASLRWFCV